MPNPRKTCPLCDRPNAKMHSPFCSQGCRDRDLLKWLGEGYRLPGEIDPDGLDSEDGTPL